MDGQLVTEQSDMISNASSLLKGDISAAIIGYYFPSHRGYTSGVLAFALPMVFFFIILVESPYWLASKGRLAAAADVLKTITNGKIPFFYESISFLLFYLLYYY